MQIHVSGQFYVAHEIKIIVSNIVYYDCMIIVCLGLKFQYNRKFISKTKFIG